MLLLIKHQVVKRQGMLSLYPGMPCWQLFVLLRFLLLEWWTGSQRVMAWYIISGCLQTQAVHASLLEITALRYMIRHIYLNEGPMYLAVWWPENVAFFQGVTELLADPVFYILACCHFRSCLQLSMQICSIKLHGKYFGEDLSVASLNKVLCWVAVLKHDRW